VIAPTLVRIALVAACALAGAALAPAPALGALIGAMAGILTVTLERAAGTLALPSLVAGALGVLAGLIGGLALGSALAPLAGGAGPGLRAGLTLLGAWLGGAVAARRAGALPLPGGAAPATPERLLDTSVLIDGRVADVAEAGLLDGALVVPRFVVHELQRLADAGDAVRRNRGRRGFDVLERLRHSPAVRLTLLDADVPGVAAVDDKLVALARARGARLLTNDGALGRIATLAGVPVSNLNELALALRPAALPGESLSVQLVREGKEAGQGVGYLDDGTMIVVEGGKRFLGQALEVVVTSGLQTAAGRMIFARPRVEEGARDA
jgi:rRNA-processing protein FCF1